MKKHIGIICLLLLALSGFSQKIYLRLNGGYGIGTTKNCFDVTTTNAYFGLDTTVTISNFQLKSITMGNGMQLGGALGTTITNLLSFEVGIRHLKNGPSKIEAEYRYDVGDEYNIRFIDHEEYKGSTISFAPRLIFNMPLHADRFYAHMGLLYNLCKMELLANLQVFSTSAFHYPFENIEATYTFEKTASMGFSLGMGYEVYLFDHVYLNADISYNQVQYTPLHAEITKYYYRSSDYLDKLTTSQREYEMVDAYTSNDNDEPNKPSQILKSTYFFNNISLMLGLKINLYK